MSTLSDLPNVGKVLEQNLMEAGISTPEQLREIGAKESFLRIRSIDPTACLHMLYGLEGAVEGIKDKFLSEETKQDLRKFFKSVTP
jgi:DNA transformation protein